MREHRLIYRTLADINAQRKLAGVAPVALTGRTPDVSIPTPVAPPTGVYDPKTRTISGGNTQQNADQSAINRTGVVYAPANARQSQAAGLNQQNQNIQKQLAAQKGMFDQSTAALGNVNANIKALEDNYQDDGSGNKTWTGTPEQLTQLNDIYAQRDSLQGSIDSYNQLAGSLNTSQDQYLPENVAKSQAASMPSAVNNALNPTVTKSARQIARENEISGTKGYRTEVFYDSEGNMHTQQVEDAGETARLQNDARNRQAMQDQNAMQNQSMQQTRNSQAGGTINMPKEKKFMPGHDSTQQGFSQIDAMIKADPDLAATYTPQLLALQQKHDALTTQYNSEVTEFNNSDKNSDGVSDGVAAAASQSKNILAADKIKQDSLNIQNRDIALESAKIAKDMAEIAKAKFDLDQERTLQLQTDANIEGERKNRLIANKLGISTEGNGLRWMQEEVRKGAETLSYLKQAGDLQDAQFALDIGRTYANNVKQATVTWDSNNLLLTQNFRASISEVDKVVTLDAKERKEERKAITKSYLDALDKNDEKTATIIKDFRTDLQHQKDQQLATKQWLATYNLTKSNADRSFNFEADKWEQEQLDKKAELVSNGIKAENDQLYRDMTTRSQLSSEIRSAYNSDKQITAYDTVYRPSYDAWGAAKAQFDKATKEGKDTSSAMQALTSAYKQITGGAQADGMAGLFSNVGLNFLSSKDQFGADDIETMQGVVQNIYDSAKSRRDGKVSALREELEQGNMTIGRSGLHVSQTQVGLPFTPPAQSQLDTLSTLSAEQRGQEKTAQIGGQSYTGPNELITRMTVADQAYFEDYGKHLKFDLSKSGDSYSLSVDPNQIDEAYDYVTGAGLSEPEPEAQELSANSLGAFYAGRVTQDFNSPIADREHGGLYDASTVAAWGGIHAGMDIAMPENTPLQAPVAGIVMEAYKSDGWGGTVVIKTPSGEEVRIAHLNSFNVKKDDVVTKGMVIAKSGNTGNSTGPHLDLRVRKGGKYIDPLTYSV